MRLSSKHGAPRTRVGSLDALYSGSDGQVQKFPQKAPVRLRIDRHCRLKALVSNAGEVGTAVGVFLRVAFTAAVVDRLEERTQRSSPAAAVLIFSELFLALAPVFDWG